jgi:hypothetical protein
LPKGKIEKMGQEVNFEEALHSGLRSGRVLFTVAIIALGVETAAFANYVGFSGGFSPRYSVVPVLPWLPAGIPWLAYAFGTICVACATGLLFEHARRVSSAIFGGLLILCTLILDLPKYARQPDSMSLRTAVCEPLAIAALAWLLPGRRVVPGWRTCTSRYLLMLCLIVFGVDHLIGLVPIAGLVPAWIPFHVFWTGFFGIAFIAAGVSIGLNIRRVWGAFGLGLMFAIWVLTLHLPRILGLYGIAGAPRNPNEWSSLFIAIALWGGSWALAGVEAFKNQKANGPTP